MEIQVRRATDGDVSELGRLIAAMAAYHEALDERERFDWEQIRNAREWLPAVLHRDHHAIWVAEHAPSQLAGYLWIRLQRSHDGRIPPVTGYINQAFLEPAWRGKGLIKRMLPPAYEWFREKGVTVVTLRVLHRNWLGSAAWYKSGFEDWYGERMLLLKPRG